MRIGAHTSIAGGVDNAVDEQREYGGNCGQIFTTSPQVWADPDVDADNAERFRAESETHDVGPWVVHTSYLVNLATPKDDLRERSIASLQADCDAAATLDIAFVNVHLGAHTGAGEAQGLENAASAIDAIDVPDGVRLLIETDAGSGTKLGDDFAHLGTVAETTTRDIGVCLDTAHAFAAGYDLSTPSAVAETIDAFDREVGLDRLECLHLNDSKHDCGTNKDEHAHLGEGLIGDDGIAAVLNHEDLRDLPFVLETPTEDGRGFEWNVERAHDLADE
ncbi:MAG: deoxyribonuclease IV [Halococcoides sp.]